MADIYLLTGLTLPAGIAHESLPGAVKAFIADCWHGMSRTQMIARAKSRGLRLSFRATGRCAHGEIGLFELRFSDGATGCLMLAHLQRVRDSRGRNRRPRRTAVSRPPARDPRQTTLF